MQPPAIPVSRKCHDAPSSAAGAGVSVIPFVVNPQVRGTDLSLVIEGDAGYSLHGAILTSSDMTVCRSRVTLRTTESTTSPG